MEKTLEQYQSIVRDCQTLFEHKLQDYGPAWRILRLPSVTDQIYIKANRIRTLQESEVQKVNESEFSEFIGILNYSIIALIQLELGVVDQVDISNKKSIELYQKYIKIAETLMLNKNHDYGEAWRDMRVSSITDLILQKIMRIKQIEDNKGKTIASEGLNANYLDMINYAIFAMILLSEKKNKRNLS